MLPTTTKQFKVIRHNIRPFAYMSFVCKNPVQDGFKVKGFL